ncbi:MAG: hypothetical protein KBH82_09395 [Syntrophorhabdaceae bacterium]|nr:hypothetical protein [Syntrophorhabdaceae bacterium]MBP8699237.1 hypothetical protein [Syntrophorhabdaceae bacterium]
MKKITEEIVENSLNKIGKKYHLINRDQFYYLLVKSENIPNTAESYNTFIEIVNDALETGESWPWRLCDCEPQDENPPYFEYILTDPKEYLRERIAEELLIMPIFNKWYNQEYMLKIIVNSQTIHKCLTCSSDIIKQVDVQSAQSFFKHNIFYSEWHRFAEISSERGKKIVILYLGNLDSRDFGIFELIRNKFKDVVFGFEHIGINVEQAKTLLPSPINNKGFKDKAFSEFQKENHIKHSYQLEAFDPWDLVELVESKIRKYYDEDLYPSEKEAEWEQAFKEVKRPLIKVVDKVLGLR